MQVINMLGSTLTKEEVREFMRRADVVSKNSFKYNNLQFEKDDLFDYKLFKILGWERQVGLS